MTNVENEVTKVTESAETTTESAEIAKVANPLCAVFDKPVFWEGKEYTEVDLSGIENLSAMDLENAYRRYASDAGVVLASVPEFSVEYCCIVASIASKIPIEFFMQLPAKTAVQIRGIVRRYFFGGA